MVGSNLSLNGRVATRPDPQLSRHIDDLYPTLEQVVEAAELARGVVSHPGWDVLTALLDAELATIESSLDSGKPLEHVEYAAKHGRRGGLKAPTQVLYALMGRAETRLDTQRSKHERDAESSPEGV